MNLNESASPQSSAFRPKGHNLQKTSLDTGPQNRGSGRSLLPRSIQNKIIYSLLLIYLIGFLAALTALTSLSHMGNKIHLLESFYELNQMILETRRYEKNYLLYGNMTDLMSALDYVDEVRAAMEKLNSQGFLPKSATGIMPGSLHQLELYADLLQRLSTGVKEKNEFDLLTANLREQGHTLTRTVILMDNMAREEMEGNINANRKMVFIILASGLIFGALLNVLLARWILEPFKYIHNAVAKIKRGELTKVPIGPKVEQCVECAELIYSLNSLLAALEAKQDELVQSAKLAAIGKVTAGIAHEINNPLNNISLTAEVFLDDFPNLQSEERIEMMHDIVNQADRAREVVRHLLDFSRLRKPTTWQLVDLNKLLQETLSLVKNQISINRITVEKSLPDMPAFIMGHAGQLQQVLVNIILNSIQAMGPGGHLHLSVFSSPIETGITIRDNGPGIAEDIRSHIFDPFFTTKDEGTGLGLSVSYAIIKEHKGDIVMESAEGQGTTFQVILPRAKPEEAE